MHTYNILFQDGFQPIHSACFKGHVNILRLLVEEYGVEPTTVLKVQCMFSTLLKLVLADTVLLKIQPF